MPRDHYYEAALEFVNERRRLAGYEPLESLPRELPPADGRTYGQSCPVGQALPGEDAWAGIAWYGDITTPPYKLTEVPEAVVEFIERFDNHAYPDLLAEQETSHA
jgi:hypothetical protein